MAKKRHYDGSSAMYDTHTSPSREQGMRAMRMGGDMIHEDHSMPSNLPGHVIRRAYPQVGAMPAPHLNDSISGIDEQMNGDARNIMRQFKTRKI